jgi:hypothetical protein
METGRGREQGIVGKIDLIDGRKECLDAKNQI